MNILVMFSGGKDSLLASCRLLNDNNNTLKLITFDNGCMFNCDSAIESTKRLQKKFGANRVNHVGVIKTIGISREFFMPYFNMKPLEQQEKYGCITPSQIHCLICKTSMYIYSIWMAVKNNCEVIATGDRWSQKFAIEQNIMIRNYKQLLNQFGNNKYNLKLLNPVYDIESDWDEDNELIRYGFLPKVLEPKCMIGCPINNSVDGLVYESIEKYYLKEMLPKIQEKFLSEENINLYCDLKNEFI